MALIELKHLNKAFGWHVVQDLSKLTHQKLSAQELQTKKDDAYTQWIQKQVESVPISPPSAVPNFGSSTSGAGTTTK